MNMLIKRRALEDPETTQCPECTSPIRWRRGLPAVHDPARGAARSRPPAGAAA